MSDNVAFWQRDRRNLLVAGQCPYISFKYLCHAMRLELPHDSLSALLVERANSIVDELTEDVY